MADCREKTLPQESETASTAQTTTSTTCGITCQIFAAVLALLGSSMSCFWKTKHAKADRPWEENCCWALSWYRLLEHLMWYQRLEHWLPAAGTLSMWYYGTSCWKDGVDWEGLKVPMKINGVYTCAANRCRTHPYVRGTVPEYDVVRVCWGAYVVSTPLYRVRTCFIALKNVVLTGTTWYQVRIRTYVLPYLRLQ